jgi:hypothetical protein
VDTSPRRHDRPHEWDIPELRDRFNTASNVLDSVLHDMRDFLRAQTSLETQFTELRTTVASLNRAIRGEDGTDNSVLWRLRDLEREVKSLKGQHETGVQLRNSSKVEWVKFWGGFVTALLALAGVVFVAWWK